MVPFVIAFFLSSAAWGSAQQPSRVSREGSVPQWRVDLHSAVSGTPVPTIAQRKSESRGKAEVSLWFTDNNTIVATFVARKPSGTSRVSNRATLDDTMPLRLRAVFLDARTGEVATTTEWPTDSRTSRIVAVHDGKFVTLRGTQLTLYARDLVALKDLKLPATEASIGWQSHPSPTGNNILFSSGEFGKNSLIWVNTEGLQIVDSWDDDLNGYVSISDKYIATSTCWSGFQVKSAYYTQNGALIVSPGPRCDSEIEIREPSVGWKTIGVGEPHQYPRFVSENLLFVPGGSLGRVIGIDGKVLFEQSKIRQSWGCWDTGILTIPDGHRFAIPSCQLKGAAPAMDISGNLVLKQIAIYDLADDVKWRKIDVKGPRIKGQMEFALSPDGSELAVLNNQFIQLFQLPPSPLTP